MIESLNKFVGLLDKHIIFVKTTIFGVFLCAAFLLFTYERSFRVHQNTISKVLRWNNRQGLFCSQVHVGHDGTTLFFQAIPTEVGSAGPIEAFPGDLVQTVSLDQFFWIVMVAIFLFLIIILLITLYVRRRNKSNES